MLSPAVPPRPSHLNRLWILCSLLLGCTAAPAPTEIGSACRDDKSCKSSTCLVDGFPDNYCSLDCSADETCPDEASCEEFLDGKICLRRCESDEECRPGYACDYGTCRPPCTDDAACHAPDLCSAERCLPPCQRDDQCPDKHRCVHTRCAYFCEADEDCPPDANRCQAGKCLPPCTEDSECLPGYTCITETGACDPKPGKKLGETCAVSSECATEYCLPTRRICSIKCTASSQCPAPWVCGLEKIDADKNGRFEQVEADCVPPKGSGIAGSLCATDAACVSAHCYDGFCMEACGTASDCGDDQCVGVSIVLDGGTPNYKGCLPRQGVSRFTVGTFPGAGSYQSVDIPPGAQSFILSAQVSSTTEMPFIGQLKDPTGAVLNAAQDMCSFFSAPIRFYPAEQFSSLFVSNTPSVAVKPGRYTFAVQASQYALPVTVELELKLGRADRGTVGINWFFLDLSPGYGFCVPGARLNAASAPTHPWFNKVRADMATIFKSANLSIGQETYHDLVNPALDAIQMSMQGIAPELQQLFASSQGMQGSKSLNIFIVRKIEVQSMAGIILGIAGGIPGPPGIHGLVHSGVALSAETACYESYGVSTGQVLAHEMGHYLGLFHNMESDENPGLEGTQVVCPCPCGAGLVCQSAFGISWCRGVDPISDTDYSPDNLMYFSADNSQSFKGSLLSAGQIRVLLDNPLVGHQ